MYSRINAEARDKNFCGVGAIFMFDGHVCIDTEPAGDEPFYWAQGYY
jgi:hypothetical protein